LLAVTRAGESVKRRLGTLHEFFSTPPEFAAGLEVPDANEIARAEQDTMGVGCESGAGRRVALNWNGDPPEFAASLGVPAAHGVVSAGRVDRPVGGKGDGEHWLLVPRERSRQRPGPQVPQPRGLVGRRR